MESNSISGLQQVVIPSKGIFKKVIKLQDSSKEPESGGDVKFHDFQGIYVEFSNGMALTQLPGDDTVILNKPGKSEEFKGASLDSDGKEVIIKNNKYIEIIYKNGSIEFDTHTPYWNWIIDKNYKKNTAKYGNHSYNYGTPVNVLRNINDTGKDIYHVDDKVVKPFVSLTELNTTYWPRK